MDTLVKKPVASAVAIVIVIGLFLSIASFATPFLLKTSGLTALNATLFFINRLLVWVVFILLCLYVRFVEKQPLLIWEESSRKWLFYLIAVLVILVVVLICNIVITKILSSVTHNEVSQKLGEYLAILKNNVPLLFFTVFTAAVVEELVFRGFIQTRIDDMFKSPAWGIIISSLFFAVVHISYGTLSQFIIPFVIGVIFSFFYWKYRNIKILIICHFLWDTFGLLASLKSH